MSNSLNGKVALVTGGSRGLGAAVALALADEGADVAISYEKSKERAEAVVAQINSVAAAGWRSSRTKGIRRLPNPSSRKWSSAWENWISS